MSSSQPKRHSETPGTANSDECQIILVDDLRDMEPHVRENLERSRRRLRESLLSDRCSIEPEKLQQLRQAAECLGRSQADLICEGLDLLYERYRDKLGDLANLEPPADAPKPPNGAPPV